MASNKLEELASATQEAKTKRNLKVWRLYVSRDSEKKNFIQRETFPTKVLALAELTRLRTLYGREKKVEIHCW